MRGLRARSNCLPRVMPPGAITCSTRPALRLGFTQPRHDVTLAYLIHSKAVRHDGGDDLGGVGDLWTDDSGVLPGPIPPYARSGDGRHHRLRSVHAVLSLLESGLVPSADRARRDIFLFDLDASRLGDHAVRALRNAKTGRPQIAERGERSAPRTSRPSEGHIAGAGTGAGHRGATGRSSAAAGVTIE